MSHTPPAGTRRRLARGEQRMAQLLAAAAEEFAEVGYESATTNSIAARAGASPGSLYQFFPNKEAMAQALADRYLAELGTAFVFLDDPALAGRPVDTLVDLVVDPVVEFTVANPAFKAVFAGSATPRHLATSSRELHTTVQRWMEKVVDAIAPDLPAERRRRTATVAMHVLRVMCPLLIPVGVRERAKLVKEFKAVLRGYLAPLAAGQAASTGTPT
jgi:AcrR family transcriptional regulator